MEFIHVLGAIFIAQTLAVVSPGPSFVIAARATVSGSRAEGLATAFGLATGTLIWATSALFGLQLLFLAFPFLYTALKLAGAAYLIHIAIQLWRHAKEPVEIAAVRSVRGHHSLTRAFRKGLLTQLANPKVAVFFGSILATLMPPAAPVALNIAALVIVVLIEIVWFASVALLLSGARVQAGYLRAKPFIDRLTALVLGTVAGRLIFGSDPARG